MKVSLLDCTLRDGGYVNDWRFGQKEIQGVIHGISDSGVDIVEVGFLRPCAFDHNKALFPAEHLIEPYISPKRPGVLYAAMVEVNNPLPIEDLCPRSDTSIDIIRVMVWNNNQEKALEYCRQIQAKGYLVCVQPVRTSQYSDDEFVAMVKLFNQINPHAIYIVDSWGTMNTSVVFRYAKVADRYMNAGISLGFHGHNNMGQAFDVAKDFVDFMCWNRDYIIDASVFGMGRGAGNLQLEIVAQYMNLLGKTYDVNKILDVYSKYIHPLIKQYHWGYSIPLLLTALHNVNPAYAEALEHLPAHEITEILTNLDGIDRIIFSKEALCKISQRI